MNICCVLCCVRCWYSTERLTLNAYKKIYDTDSSNSKIVSFKMAINKKEKECVPRQSSLWWARALLRTNQEQYRKLGRTAVDIFIAYPYWWIKKNERCIQHSYEEGHLEICIRWILQSLSLDLYRRWHGKQIAAAPKHRVKTGYVHYECRPAATRASTPVANKHKMLLNNSFHSLIYRHPLHTKRLTIYSTRH